MSEDLWFDKLVNNKLPESLQQLQWEGTDQQSAEDIFGNAWIRNSPGEMYISIDSDYRLGVYMTLTLIIDDNNQVEYYQWDGTLASHGRPAGVEPQAREVNQVVRVLKQHFGKL